VSPFRRIITIAVLVIATMAVSASCSAQQVQAWWSFTGHGEITLAKAQVVADNLNAWEARNRALRVYLDRVGIPNEANWDRVAACESGGNWALSSGNGFYGGLQFTLSTWRAYGGSGYPNQNSKAEQIRVAERVRTSQGLGAWPVCGSRF
jgi:resuscitation-promoting factor RpfE